MSSQSEQDVDRLGAVTPTINIEKPPENSDIYVVQEINGRETPEAKRRCDAELQEELLMTSRDDVTRLTSHEGRWCETMSDGSQGSSTRPISLCVKYSGSEDNLLAIESEIAALEQETSFDKLQRQFDNSCNLSDIFDCDDEIQRRRSMSALPSIKNKQYYGPKGNETPTKTRIT